MKIWFVFFLLGIYFPLMAAETKPITLQEGYQMALLKAESVAIQEEEIRAAAGRYHQALGGFLPHLSVKGSELIQDTSGVDAGEGAFASSFARKSRPEVAINLQQPLFQGFREFRSLSASAADREKNRLLWERAKQLLFLDLAQVYLSVLEAEEELKIIESQREVLKKRIADLSERVRLGQSRRSEVLNTESQASLLEADLSAIQGRLLVARQTFAFLTGLPESTPLVRPDEVPSPTPPLGHFLKESESRADVQATQFDLKLAQARKNYEFGGYLPQLNLEANYYPYRVGFQSEIDWDLLFTLNIPLFQGGLTKGRVQEAKAKLIQSELSHSESKRRSFLEIRQAYEELLSSQEEAKSLKVAEEKTYQNYQIHQKEYRVGLVNNLDLLQSLRDHYEVKRRGVRAGLKVLLNDYRLKAAAGEVP